MSGAYDGVIINNYARDAAHQLFEEEHPDIVVDFAAESHVDRSIENPGNLSIGEYYWHINCSYDGLP